jgi:hypothetical protein
MARLTSSSDRAKRQSRSNPVVSSSKGRQNRISVSTAKVSNADTRTRTGTARVTSNDSGPPKSITRQSRVNGRLKPGTDTRPSPNTRASAKPAVKPAGPTPYQVSDPWAKPARPSIGNVSGPASKPNRPSTTPKPAVKPSGNFKAPTVPKSPTRYPSSPLSSQPNGAKMGRIGAGGALRGGAEAALLAAGQAGVDALAPVLGKGLARALTPVGRRIDDMMPGINSKDEAKRVKAKTPLRTMTAAENARAVRLPQATGNTSTKPNRPTATNGNQAPVRRTSTQTAMPSAVKPRSNNKPETASTKQGQVASGTGVRKYDDFNPNRGTSKSNNPLLDRKVGDGPSLRDMMKEREAKDQASKLPSLSNKSNQDSGFKPKQTIAMTDAEERRKKLSNVTFNPASYKKNG